MKKTAVLIVEDEAIVASDLFMKLQQLGYEITGAASRGDLAVEMAGELHPDLVLMDIQLEGTMDGIEAAEEIRQKYGLPVIYLTAHADKATLSRAKVTGALGYILKPFEKRELVTQIELALYRHEYEKKIREYGEWLRVTLNSIGDAVIASDAEGRITFINPAAESLTGWKYQDAAGQPFDQIFKIIEEPTGKVIEVDSITDTKGTPVKVLSSHAILVAKDGKTVPIEDSAAPILNATGEKIGSVLVFQNVTEKRRAEEELRESALTHRKILQTAMDGFWRMDHEGRLLEVNGAYCRMSGYSEKELLGMKISDLEVSMPPDQIHDNIQMIKSREKHRFETRHRRKDGSVFDVEISSQYHNELGGIFYVFTRDITENKRLQARLSQAQKMESIGTLAGGIAHDFNNILSPILLYSEFVMSEIEPDNPLQDSVKEIYTAGERARKLVRQILTFARKGSGERIRLRASLIIDDAVKFLRSTIPSSIDIRYENRAGQDSILADPTQLNQIIMNLCTNAAHAMQKNGGILDIILENRDITAREAKWSPDINPGRYLLIAVEDNGAGIPTEDLDRIFEPYYTTKDPGEGTGLGLAIIHGIVQDYGGHIEVKSQVGKGTIFHVYLPVSESGNQTIKQEKARIPRGNEHILFVDDEEAAVKAMKKILERLGYRVTATTSSQEALEIFKKNPESFDLVITDMTMPEMTGDRLAEELMSVRPGIPVILCSGYTEKIDEETATKKGIGAFIIKPVVMSEIAMTIRNVLE